MADTLTLGADRGAGTDGVRPGHFTHPLILFAFGAAIFLGTIFAPPSLMDDVDAVNAQIARNMLDSGDWVTARINGVVYLEKSPLGFWVMAVSYAIFGVHDWSARLPFGLGAIALMWVTAALGRWGFGRRAGFYAGLAVGANVGLFLFTRIVIPDVLLTLAVTCAFYCFLRALDGFSPPRPDAPSPPARWWAWGFWAAIGVGMLLKGLIAAVLPVATGVLYLLFRRQLLDRQMWRRLRPLSGIGLTLLIWAPWVVLATLRNPPLFDLTMHSDPGVYRGFFWFYFINEHVLRYLGLRYPHDYNTVPRIPFLLMQLLWLFPWSVFWPAALKAPAADDRARQLRVLAVVWVVFLLVFLSFSTTQEYYSMPCYPGMALLAGWGLAAGPRRWVAAGYGLLAVLGLAGGAVAAVILYLVRGVKAVGDISAVLTQNPEAYTLALGHMSDLTLRAFAYLRMPLALAGFGLAAGAAVAWLARRSPVAPLCLAAMMTLCVQAAHRAMAVFDPYLSSRPLAEAIRQALPGQLIVQGHYYPASSVVFYTYQPALLLHGRVDNLVYGSAAPGAPPVFLEDADLKRLWKEPRRLYLVAPVPFRLHFERTLGAVYVLAESGGKCVLSNLPT